MKSVKSIKSIRSVKSLMPGRSLKLIRPVIAIMFCLMTLSMMQSDRKERVRECASRSGDGAIYLKEFVVKLPKGEKGEPPPNYHQTVILRGNNIYRFNLCNDKGQAIIRLDDSFTMLISSYDSRTNKDYNPINFLCRKTGQYNIVITFKDRRAGEAVGIMSHVMK